MSAASNPSGGARTALVVPPSGPVARVAAGVRRGLTNAAAWFGPGTPPVAAAPEVSGRRFDFPAGVNLAVRPRAYEAPGFVELRALADAYDLLRLVVETLKDRMAGLDWAVRPRRGEDGRRPPMDGDARVLARRFQRPDGENDWPTWLRLLLEDLLVIDAPTLYVRRDRAGRPAALEVMDGATIKRVLDPAGRTPLPPDPAYQQVLKGMPAVDYTTEEIIYRPRNPRPHRAYGMSPVEQVLLSVNIALRRQASQLAYYTEGNLPEALIGVPDSWTPDQIATFQSYWDSLLEGNAGARRHTRFVPGGMKYQPVREPALKDDYDEWLARVVCYAFGVPATPFTRQVNRATAETAEDVADREGLAPLMGWAKALVDRLLADLWGRADLEFVWLPAAVIDPTVQARIDALYIQAGVMTPDEIRGRLGLPPHSPSPPPPQSTPEVAS